MGLPIFPRDPNEMTRADAINQVISSIAMEELGMSHILNAEGEKLQYVLGTLPGSNGLNPTVDELLNINHSVKEMLQASMQNQMLLQNKMTVALNAAVVQGPPGPTGAACQGTWETITVSGYKALSPTDQESRLWIILPDD